MTAIRSVRVLVASAGNEFMRDIAHMFAAGFATHGVPTDVVVDGLPSTSPQFDLVVAPHEYFPMFLDKLVRPAEIDVALQQVAVLNVEQPGSPWFETAWEYTRRARIVFDISLDGVHELRRRGVAAVYAPLGHVESLEPAAMQAAEQRSIDIVFLGHASRRREEFLANHAEFLSRYNCHVVLADIASPRQPTTPGYWSGVDRIELLRDAKILINVHSSDRTYFETHRALMALSNGCLLISESSRHTAPLEAGRHFVMTPLEDIPAACRHDLADLSALTKVALAGHSFVRNQMRMSHTAAVMLRAFDMQLHTASATLGSGQQHPRPEDVRTGLIR